VRSFMGYYSDMSGTCGGAGELDQIEPQAQEGDEGAAVRKRRPACGAKNRSGSPCRVAPVPGKRRCRFHGGLSTGPKTVEGKLRIAAAQRRRWARRRGEDIRTERLRPISPIRIGPDDICALGAEDPEVRAASARLDRATPSTYRDLVAARLAAQACFGVPENKRVPLYSGEVEDFLVPIMFRMRRGDEVTVVAELRKELTRRYGEFSEMMLMFMLKSYRHHNTEALLRAARTTPARSN
jgi:hypothetical protein